MTAIENALANLPAKFRTRLVKHYAEIKTRIAKARFDREYDTSGLSAGKFSEVVLRLLQEKLTAQHIPFEKAIGNFAAEVDKLTKLPSTSGTESERVIIPRALLFLYTVRNKRDVGHVGGDVEANESDATATAKLADWVVCELIRVYHGKSLEEAQALVDSINSRSVPSVWEINGKKRVLAPGLKASQKVLVLAYTDIEHGVLVEDMQAWVKYENPTNFRNQVLRPLDDQGLIEYARDTQTIHLSPTGVEEVEARILSVN